MRFGAMTDVFRPSCNRARAKGSHNAAPRTEYIGRVPKWPSSVVRTIFFAKCFLKNRRHSKVSVER